MAGIPRDVYDALRPIFDLLPPGIYVKCHECGGWTRNGGYTARHIGSTDMEVTCEDCEEGVDDE